MSGYRGEIENRGEMGAGGQLKPLGRVGTDALEFALGFQIEGDGLPLERFMSAKWSKQPTGFPVSSSVACRNGFSCPGGR